MTYSLVGDSPVSVDSGLANAAPMSPAKPVIVASARKANRSRASVEEDRGRVVRVVIWVLLHGVGGRTPLMLLSDYCQIDAPHCQTLPNALRSDLRDGNTSPQIGSDHPGGGVLPDVQRTLRHLGNEPVPCLAGDRIQAGGRSVLRVGPDADDVGEVQRVVMAPLVGGAEVAVTRSEERR